MGVYIPNMEKPSCCALCLLSSVSMGKAFCSLLDKEIGEADMLTDCPLIEIVRCGECKWYGVSDGMPYCDWRLREIEPDVFCSYGEREEE